MRKNCVFTEVCLYLSGAKYCLLSIFDQALLTKQVAIGTLCHLLERKLSVAAATLNELAVLQKESKVCGSEIFKLFYVFQRWSFSKLATMLCATMDLNGNGE